MLLLSFAYFFFKIVFFSKTIYQDHFQIVNQFGSRSGPAFCWSRSGSKLFAKFISRLQKSLVKVHESLLSAKFQLLYRQITYFLALSLLDVVLIMQINVKMQTIVGILTFMSRINFMLS